jgi:hypothetical protein
MANSLLAAGSMGRAASSRIGRGGGEWSCFGGWAWAIPWICPTMPYYHILLNCQVEYFGNIAISDIPKIDFRHLFQNRRASRCGDVGFEVTPSVGFLQLLTERLPKTQIRNPYPVRSSCPFG